MKRRANKYLYPKGDKEIATDINDAVEKILLHHHIAPDTQLARIIGNAVRKFLIGLEQKFLNCNDWLMKNKKALCINDPLDKNTRNLKFLVAQFYQADKVPQNFMRYFNTELGRLKTQLNTYNLINVHSHEIGYVSPKSDNKNNPTLAVLGTMIREVIDLHADKYGIHESFPRNILAERDDLKELKQRLTIK